MGNEYRNPFLEQYDPCYFLSNILDIASNEFCEIHYFAPDDFFSNWVVMKVYQRGN